MTEISKIEAVINVLRDWRLTASGLIGIAFLLPVYPPVVQFFLAILGFNLLFNAFDLLGYRNVLQSENNNHGIELPSYRIMQVLFQVTLLLLIYCLYGWKAAACAELLHICGLQDLLYYFVGKYKLPGVWTWLTWTPIGFFKDVVTDNELFIQIGLGFVVSGLVYFSL